jgi:probable F420-dependent oxidoreductase
MNETATIDTKTQAGPLIHIRPSFEFSVENMDATLAYAERIERMGFDGVFVGDRMLSDAEAQGRVVYSATMVEVTTIMAAMAARTSRIKVGVLVYIVPYRHPLQTAKVFASLDVLAKGRIVMGAGVGWNPKEFEALGLNMAERGSRFEEAIPLIRQLWSGDRVTLNGRWWTLEGVQIAPASPRRGGPPIWMASFAPSHSLDFNAGFAKPIRGALERVGRLADGWAPLTYSASAKRRISAAQLGQAWDIVQGSASAAGRDPDGIDVVHSDWIYVLDGAGAEERAFKAVSTFFTGDWAEAKNTYVIGTPDQVVEQLLTQTSKIDHKVNSYLLTPISGELDQLELIRDRVAPQLRASI